jgi:predicted Rossmann-fold nucleotide-binding protein
VLNVQGFYDGLLRFLDQVVDEGLLRPAHRALLHVAAEPRALLAALRTSESPTVRKWIGPDEE